MDVQSISAALASVRAIYDLLKNVKDAQIAMGISSEVANVQGRLLDVQQQALAIQNENQELRAEVAKFRSYVQHHSVIWRRRPDETEDGPFCPVCNGEGRDMRLILRPYVDQSTGRYYMYCPRLHAGKADKVAPFIGASPEPIYEIPAELVPKDYFSLPIQS